MQMQLHPEIITLNRKFEQLFVVITIKLAVIFFLTYND